MGLRLVWWRCDRIWRAAAEANEDSKGLCAGKRGATGVGRRSCAQRDGGGGIGKGDRTGDMRSLDRALPIRTGEGRGWLACLGLEFPISMSSLPESIWTMIDSLPEELELLCEREAARLLSSSPFPRNTSSSGILSGVNVPGYAE